MKVYGQDGETICFEVQVGLAGVMVPGREAWKDATWRTGRKVHGEAADNGTPVV